MGKMKVRSRPSWAGIASVTLAALGLCAGSGTAQVHPAPHAVHEQAVRVDGVTFHVRSAGSGPPLLLLHGFSGAGQWWDPMVQDLASRHSVIVPDLPLHGHSTGREGWRYDEVAGDVLALMDSLGIGTFRAIGYSAGGEVLLQMATRHPERFEAIVFVSAVHRVDEAGREIMRTWPAFEDMPQHIRDYWMEVHPGGAAQVQVLIEALRDAADDEDAMNFAVDDVARITAPTLIVVGDRDEFAPLEVALEFYQALPNAGLWVVPGQGHSPILADWGGSPEAQRVFADVLNRFFEAPPP